MIIKCEKCRSEFNLDENLIKKDGSIVRCSVCKKVFKVFPPEQDLFDTPVIEDDFSNTAMEETVALDFSPDFESEESETIKKDMEYSFDRAFEEAMEEVVEDEELIVPEEEPAPEKEQDTTELHEEKTESVAVKMDGVKKKTKERSKKPLLISLLILLALIIAFLIIFFSDLLPDSFYSRSSSTKESAMDAGAAKLDFEGVKGSFANSDKAGRLYIIKGSVINNDQKPRSFILLKGAILNREGSAVKQETAYVGNTFSDEELNNMSADDIKISMKIQTGMYNNNVDVKPGSSVPFMIVFSDLPDDMSEFTLEAVSSSYGE